VIGSYNTVEAGISSVTNTTSVLSTTLNTVSRTTMSKVPPDRMNPHDLCGAPRDRRLEVALQVADQRNQSGGKLHAERDGVAEHQASNGLIQRIRQSPAGAASQLQPSIRKGLLRFSVHPETS